jgi:hypothetical protein
MTPRTMTRRVSAWPASTPSPQPRCPTPPQGPTRRATAPRRLTRGISMCHMAAPVPSRPRAAVPRATAAVNRGPPSAPRARRLQPRKPYHGRVPSCSFDPTRPGPPGKTASSDGHERRPQARAAAGAARCVRARRMRRCLRRRPPTHPRPLLHRRLPIHPAKSRDSGPVSGGPSPAQRQPWPGPGCTRQSRHSRGS